VRLSDLATIRDTFRDQERRTRFGGRPAAVVRVFRIGDQTPLSVSRATSEVLETMRRELPPKVSLTIWNDTSEMFAERMQLLMRNGLIGLALVLIIIGVFLDPRLALWVTVGIPISFLGAVFVMAGWGISINMISIFAFIVVLGIVVDDAIVVAEAAHDRHRDGATAMDSAVDGVREMRAPVTFAVLTSIAAFVPQLFVPGTFGKFFIGSSTFHVGCS
jgi:multidrug efflux pump subunit AcrB